MASCLVVGSRFERVAGVAHNLKVLDLIGAPVLQCDNVVGVPFVSWSKLSLARPLASSVAGRKYLGHLLAGEALSCFVGKRVHTRIPR